MRQEAKHIQFKIGHAHFYMKNKVDRTMHTEYILFIVRCRAVTVTVTTASPAVVHVTSHTL